MNTTIRFTWHKSLTTGKRIYEIYDGLTGKLLYSGANFLAASRVRRRLESEGEKLDEYNKKWERNTCE